MERKAKVSAMHEEIGKLRLKQFLQVPRNLRSLILEHKLTTAEILSLLVTLERTAGLGVDQAPISNGFNARMIGRDERTSERARKKLRDCGLITMDIDPNCRRNLKPAVLKPCFEFVVEGTPSEAEPTGVNAARYEGRPDANVARPPGKNAARPSGANAGEVLDSYSLDKRKTAAACSESTGSRREPGPAKEEEAAAPSPFSENETSSAPQFAVTVQKQNPADEVAAVEQIIVDAGIKCISGDAAKILALVKSKGVAKSKCLELIGLFVAWKNKQDRVETSRLLVLACQQNDIEQFMESKGSLNFRVELQFVAEQTKKQERKETPVTLELAIHHLWLEMFTIPPIIEIRLKRQAVEEISPNGIKDLVRKLPACQECRQSGVYPVRRIRSAWRIYLALLLAACTLSATHVRTYTRKDGTVVHAHERRSSASRASRSPATHSRGYLRKLRA